MKKILRLLCLTLTVFCCVGLATVQDAAAFSDLTVSKIAETNMTTSAGSALGVAFTTSASATAAQFVELVFPVGFTVAASQTFANCPVNFSSGLPGSNLPGASAPTAAGATQTVTVTLNGAGNNLANTTAYCFELTGASSVTNPSGTGQNSVTINTCATSACTGANLVDTSTVELDTISSDNYTVSATVSPTFSLTLSGASDPFGILAPGSVSGSTGVSATVGTNAANGWFLWSEDNNAGLKSNAANHTIASLSANANHTLSAGSEAYVLGVTSVGHGSATAAYTSNGTTTGGGLSNSTYYEVASDTQSDNNDVVALKELATIDNVTPAAQDYTDTITVVGAGSF